MKILNIKVKSALLLSVMMLTQMMTGSGQKSSYSLVSMSVSGACGMCEERIETAALGTKGVKMASWNSNSQKLEVEVDEASFEQGLLHFNIAAIGHDTDQVSAKASVYDALPLCCHYKDSDNPHKMEMKKEEAKSFSYRVSGICGMCKERIEGIALETKGVDAAYWDSETQYLTVETSGSEFDDWSMLKNIAKAGHDTDVFEADQKAYSELPNCCQYNEPDNPHLQEKDNKSNSGSIIGTVFEKNDDGDLLPLLGANIYLVGSSTGTSTDEDGNFEIEWTGENQKLVVSYIGYETDTLLVSLDEGNELDIVLSSSHNLETIEIVHRKKSTEISMVDPIKVHRIGEDELMKAACCNLSESFTTTPSIDVSFTDAVTGTRKIEMLGLAGKYVQIMSESLPDIRALSSINGLTYIPGPWIEGIQLNMGTGSVVNGFESMTGQINVEMKKPWEADQLYLNLYANMEGRLEANTNVSHVINDTWSTGLLLHASKNNRTLDHNEDGFLDMPTGDNLIASHRWKFRSENGIMSQIGFKTTQINKKSGQSAFFDDLQQGDFWGAVQKTNRNEAWFKLGRIFPSKPYASLGFQLHGVNHDQEFSFGKRQYNGLQQSLFANLIYQSIFGTTTHQYRTGVSFLIDKVDEQIADMEFLRDEKIPGAYFEYTYKPDDKITVVAGMRGDYHNNYGFFMTPRLNAKYAFSDRTVVRAAAGKGQRTASIFSENLGFLASSRDFEVIPSDDSNPYGLKPEVAWNYGLNFTQVFDLFGSESVIAVDAYRTQFVNQIIVDIEQSDRISFYNLDGESFSNSIQVQWDFTPFERLDVRMAYRFNDVRSTYDGELLQKALSSKHRAFVNFGYTTENKWKFDMTLNWQGEKRIPDTSINPEPYQLEGYSPDFYLMNAQISKGWGDNIELYVGGENLLNFRQENPIIASDDPFGQYFDSSLVWGPVFGRNIYAGLRYRIK